MKRWPCETITFSACVLIVSTKRVAKVFIKLHKKTLQTKQNNFNFTKQNLTYKELTQHTLNLSQIVFPLLCLAILLQQDSASRQEYVSWTLFKRFPVNKYLTKMINENTRLICWLLHWICSKLIRAFKKMLTFFNKTTRYYLLFSMYSWMFARIANFSMCHFIIFVINF